ncbi:Exoglucanase, partial [Leucoagaricus sp. SymC.cos]
RWLHTPDGCTNCFTGNAWDTSICIDGATCAEKSRVYLMADEFNQEFSFNVDVSNHPCGLNGALYSSEMAADGGLSDYPGNKAGAKCGTATGHCDSQCLRDIKFINGEANVADRTGSPTDSNAGTGDYGISRCEGTACGTEDRYATVCDPDGCDLNSYRMDDSSFYGRGKTVDTTKKLTIVTQFITNNNSSTGALSEIRRLYVQDGKVIQNSKVNVPSMDAYDSITSAYCHAQKSVFEDTTQFQKKGDLAGMSATMARGMVLILFVQCDAAQTQYGQCGGQGWSGPTACVSGTICTILNPY